MFVDEMDERKQMDERDEISISQRRRPVKSKTGSQSRQESHPQSTFDACGVYHAE